jgi:hypothetical protein
MSRQYKSLFITTGLLALLSTNLFAETLRPTGKSKLSQVRSSRSKWAKYSNKRGVDQLIVVFEGLSSFSQSYANKTYALYDLASKGKLKGSKTRKAPMNFVMKNLIGPQMSQIAKRSEILLLSEKTQRKKSASVASTCLAEWSNTYNGQLDIVIIGHSFGGYSAINLSQRLHENSIPVKAVFTMDARTYPNKYKEFWTPKNVNRHINHFQKGVWMPGYKVKGAENSKFSTNHSGITNIEESKRVLQEII